MRESRQSGSEGGAAQINAPFLPLSFAGTPQCLEVRMVVEFPGVALKCLIAFPAVDPLGQKGHLCSVSLTEVIRMILEQITGRGGLHTSASLEPAGESNSDLLLPLSKRQSAVDLLYND